MAKVLILGAGISGHTAALTAKRRLGKQHEVIVVSPNSNYQWVPSNIWVGVGRMTTKQVIFPLAPVYAKQGIIFKQAKAVSIHPEGSAENDIQHVRIEYVAGERKGESEIVEYDFLINATGPKLNFEATEGLGPELYSNSVCTYDHAAKSWEEIQKCLSRMEKGEMQRFLIGTGNGMSTCQGAAFEFALNLTFEIRERKLDNFAEVIWISNEYELGDFGMGGAYVKQGGYVTPTKIFTESIFKEYGIKWIVGSAIQKVEQGMAYYENIAGEKHNISFDFSMLIPAFAGVGLKAYNKSGDDITAKLFAPNGFMKVDADYSSKPYDEWKASDWPSTYQNPEYGNIFACGIAFAPPHTISKPMTSKNGTSITATAPRTGMPSGVIGKIVAENIAEMVLTGKNELKHRASMAKMGAACVISAGYGLTKGKAATMTVFPIVQDWEKYPKWGRNLGYTVGEMGRAGHWFKWAMHYMFIYKAKANPLWWLIPE